MNNIQMLVNSVDIVDEISKYLELTPSGANYVCTCPFHADTNPSLTISRDKKIFKCFVCGTGGNVINFVEKFEKISFVEAMKKISKENNIKINYQEKKNLEILEPLNYCLNDTSTYYHSLLQVLITEDPLKTYLEKRKISIEAIKKFSLGYSNGDGKSIADYLQKKISTYNNYSMNEVQKAKILNENHFEFFYQRLIIPIRNENGNVVGFSGRLLTKNDKYPKYLNSSDSEFFKKREILYNYDRVIENNPQELIITEGFFDVIKLSSINENNAVASMGTAITDYHIKLINKLKIKKIYLGFDNDFAGKKTTNEVGITLFNNCSFQILVLDLRGVKDIDEYIEKYQLTDSESLKKKAVNFKEFQLEYLLQHNSLETMDNKISLIKSIFKNISKLEPLEQDIIISKVSDLTKIKEEIIRNNYLNNEVKVLGKKEYLRKNNYQIKKSNILFADNETIIIYKIYQEKNLFIETLLKLESKNYKFEKYQHTIDDLKKYYKNNDKFSFINFTDLYHQSSHDLEDISKKIFPEKINLDSIINEYLNKEKKKWNLFKE